MRLINNLSSFISVSHFQMIKFIYIISIIGSFHFCVSEIGQFDQKPPTSNETFIQTHSFIDLTIGLQKLKEEEKILIKNYTSETQNIYTNHNQNVHTKYPLPFKGANISHSYSLNQNPYYFPRNITDIYRGTWSWLSLVTPQEIWDFDETKGEIMFQLTNEKTDAPLLDKVHGEMVIRNGLYSTSSNHKFIFQGVYFHQEGVLFLISNPQRGEPLISNINISIDKNTTFDSFLQKMQKIQSSFPSFSVPTELSDIYTLGKHTLVPTSESLIDPNINNSSRTLPRSHKFSILDFGSRRGENSAKCYFESIFKVFPIPVFPHSSLKYGFSNDKNMEAKGEVEERRRGRGEPLISMKGYSWSPNCHFLFEFESKSILFQYYFTKSLNYALMVIISSIVQILFLIKQMDYTNTQAAAAKVSLLTIGQQAIIDSYLCLLHLTTGIVMDSVFNAFATAAFLKFITFSVFEMRYILVIWKSRRPQAFANGVQSIRGELSVIYARFYVFIMGGFLLIYYINGIFNLFLLLMYSFWIPQIVCNVEQRSRKPLQRQYIIGITVTRLLIPLYFYGCPENFVHAEPNNMVYILSIYLIAQATFLLLQERFGSDFFIPSQLLPEKYNYHRSLRTITRHTDSLECTICMSPIESSNFSDGHMITPCDHVFHSDCLLKWMEHKMECPTCRRVIPYT